MGANCMKKWMDTVKWKKYLGKIWMEENGLNLDGQIRNVEFGT